MIKQQSILFGAVGLFILGTGCSGSSNQTAPSSASIIRQNVPDSAFKPTALENTIDGLVSEINKSPRKTTQIGVVLKALTGYFQPIEVGANRATSELKAVGGVVAPANQDDTAAAASQQNEMIDNCVAGNYDGIGVAPFDETTVPSIDAAVDKGIPGYYSFLDSLGVASQ